MKLDILFLDILFAVILLIIAFPVILGTIDIITEKEYFSGRVVDCYDFQNNKILDIKCQEIVRCGIITNIFSTKCDKLELIK